MTHLGARVTALVDGRLPAEEAEEALAHTVACYGCAELLRRERASRRALSQAGDVVPDEDLTARLLAIQRPGGYRARDRPPSRTALVGIGAAAALGVAVAGLPLVGALAELRTDPNDILAAVQGKVGTVPQDLPAGVGEESGTPEVVGWLAERGWSMPESLPDGTTVVGVEIFETDSGEVLEVEMAGRTSSVRMLQQRGQLASSTSGGEEEVVSASFDDGGHSRMGAGGQHVVLQSGDCVVVVTPAVSGNPVGAQVLEVMPATEYNTSVVGRFSRGWQVLASWASN